MRAKVILDSVSPDGVRLTTIELKLSRSVLAEFNTHRVFSRNSASSRAIPTSKLLKRVRTNPVLPEFYGKNQSGMQAEDEMSPEKIESVDWVIKGLARKCADAVEKLKSLGLHKQNANRYIEPFLEHTVLVTSTEWSNFFNQRYDKLAQPEIRVAAEDAYKAINDSWPVTLDYGDWHLPFCSELTADQIKEAEDLSGDLGIEAWKQISTARCARVSYLNHDGEIDVKGDLRLYKRLLGDGHWSPFEHIATPRPVIKGTVIINGRHIDLDPLNYSGNFYAWEQFRKEFHGENQSKFRELSR